MVGVMDGGRPPRVRGAPVLPKSVKRRSRALIAGSSLRLEFGGQEDAVLLGLLSLSVADDLCTQYLSRQ
jgi:hypothetical protein